VIKAEPPDSAEDESTTPMAGVNLTMGRAEEAASTAARILSAPAHRTGVKVEPVEVPSVATTSRAPPHFFFPSLSPQLAYPPHLQHLLGKVEPASEDQQEQQPDAERSSSRQFLFNSNIFSQQQPDTEAVSLGPAKRRSISGGSGKQPAAFTCQKCGKSYNWNYNLNRHIRFECGIENRFECAVCQKRFPYKQNAAIHLKRKHKLTLENADDMLAAGHIVLMAGAAPRQPS
jgi:hypothetical protein